MNINKGLIYSVIALIIHFSFIFLLSEIMLNHLNIEKELISAIIVSLLVASIGYPVMIKSYFDKKNNKILINKNSSVIPIFTFFAIAASSYYYCKNKNK